MAESFAEILVEVHKKNLKTLHQVVDVHDHGATNPVVEQRLRANALYRREKRRKLKVETDLGKK